MTAVKDALARAWDRLNPSEPSPFFLAYFMAAALTIFALGFLIGAL